MHILSQIGAEIQLTIYYIFINFFIYGFIGWCAEVAFAALKERRFVNRGFLNGPYCPIYGVGVTAVVMLMRPFEENLLFLFVASSILVTVLEWLTGFLLEALFHHKWWDYTGMPLNLNGYVCLPFSLMWGVACVVIVKLLHPLIFKGYSFLPVWLGTVILSVLSAAFIADLCVTVSGILKINKKLEKMEEIAAELHRISEQVGENIYHNVMEGMERQEAIREKREEYQRELREREAELREKYAEFLEHSSRTGRRILRAFPKMQSKKHREIWGELRKKHDKLYQKIISGKK